MNEEVDPCSGRLNLTFSSESDFRARYRPQRHQVHDGGDRGRTRPLADHWLNHPGRLSARIQSELFNRLVSLAAGTSFRDVASETRVFRRQVVEETPLYGDFYRYLPLLAERLGFDVREIPAAQDPRARAPVVHSLRLYLWRAMDVLSIFFVSRFTRHPLRLFGGVGSAFAALGALILLVAAIQRFTGTPLADRPVLVLGTLLVGLGVQTFTIGLLGELILFFHARGIRDYRVSAVHEGAEQLPPAAPHSEAQKTADRE